MKVPRLFGSDLADRRAVVSLFVTATLLALPFVFSPSFAAQILIFAIFALGYNILLGYGGEMSFGHAAFFGLGAYGAILSVGLLGLPLLASLLAGVVLATMGSAVIGKVSLRRRGIGFAMITLAFAQMFYFIAYRWNAVTGGTDGASYPLEVEGIGPVSPAAGDLGFYLFCLAVFGIVWLAIARIVDSPFGQVLVAIRENEKRVRFLGHDPDHMLFVAFVLSGLVSGVAGSLFAVLFAFVTPDVLFWEISGEVILMTVLGGAGTLVGPVIGAAGFLVLSDQVTELFDVWTLVFGSIVVVVVLLAPNGIYGTYLEKWR